MNLIDAHQNTNSIIAIAVVTFLTAFVGLLAYIDTIKSIIKRKRLK